VRETLTFFVNGLRHDGPNDLATLRALPRALIRALADEGLTGVQERKYKEHGPE